MFKAFKLNKRIRALKKNLTPREQILFDTLRANESGLTSEECKKSCGYAMTGWTANVFNDAGIKTQYIPKSKVYKIISLD